MYERAYCFFEREENVSGRSLERELKMRTHLFVEQGDVEDAALDGAVDREGRRQPRAIEYDSSAAAHLRELAPVDLAVAHVGFDLVDDGDILEVHAAVKEGKRSAAALSECEKG